MGVEVDEPGCDGESVDIDLVATGGLDDPLVHRDDPATVDADVATRGRATGAVVARRVADHDVDHGRFTSLALGAPGTPGQGRLQRLRRDGGRRTFQWSGCDRDRSG